ncbi:outer membrane protein assembly factor BamE [Rhodobacteraceae bacterium W635]|uniref:outer membrane protein assembly factor BamE n=1 Tax=Nioella halotolerans TaxID=2303578 RepID=UPI000E3BB32A|nr:outer membrane protein assembly factor BamE [Rhodobacteraceae bacterium W635]
MIGQRRGARLILAGILALVVGACSATYTNHGYIPPAEDLEMILPGVDTRASVEETIGQPSTAGVMSSDTWFYIASRQRHFTYRAAEVVERDIVAISFDDSGTVQNIRELGLEDGEVVRFSRRVTESNIQEVTFLRQLIGNIGRVNIGEALTE